MPNAWIFSSALVGYLLGSLPFGYLVARAHGVDIFKVGSGNPGATNVKRVLGAKAGNTVFALDAVKGAVAAGWPMLPFLAAPDVRMMGLVGVIAAVLGHSFSVFTKFKGGKGVATAAGAIMAINPLLGLFTLASWLIVAFFFRYSSLASLVAAVFAPFYQALIWGPETSTLAIAAMSLLLVWRHEGNIRKLLAGTESKIGAKAAPVAAAPAQPAPGHAAHVHTHRHAQGHPAKHRKGH